MENRTQVIIVEEATKTYNSVTAVDKVNLSLLENEIYGLIGPDGAGKTSLIRMICTLLKPDSGKITVKGLVTDKDYRKIRSKLGYMPQKFSLYQDLSVEQNLNFFASLFRIEKVQKERKIEELYNFSGLKPFCKRKAGALSGGMKQKLALSCNLVHQPEILILDEPTFGVDPVSRIEFWEMLFKIKENGVPILVTTAYMDEAEKCDRISFMHKGIITATGTPDEIISNYPYFIYRVSGNQQFLKQFFKNQKNLHQIRLFGHELHVSFPEELSQETIGLWKSQCHDQLTEISGITPSIEDVFLEVIT